MEKNNTSRTLNELLVNLFNNVMDREAKAVITEEFKDITNNDMHIIEAIGIEEPQKMSAIAKRLSVTVGTLTTNMNSLDEKGYIKRERSLIDKRVVLVSLTDKGRKAFFHHRDFHKHMIQAVVKDLDEDETKVLIKCLRNISSFLLSIKSISFLDSTLSLTTGSVLELLKLKRQSSYSILTPSVLSIILASD